MQRKNIKNTLVSVGSLLLEEWDYEKNASLMPSMISISSHKKVWWKCSKCGNEWEARIDHRVNGHGCKKCAGKRISNSKRKTHDQFIAELYTINQNIEILSEYINSKEHVQVHCKICNHIWFASPSKLLSGRSCPLCGRRKTGDARRKSINDVKARLKQVNPNIEIIGNYISVDKPIECRCITCGHVWFPTISNLYGGKGCPKCSGVYRRTHEDFLQEMKEKNPEVIILGKYINSTTKIECSCSLCGFTWSTTPYSLLSGSGCRKCHSPNRIRSVAKRVKTHDDFINEVYSNINNQDIEILSSYQSADEPVLCKCKGCGTEWKILPGSLIKGQGCRKCNSLTKRAKEFSEKIINNHIPIDVLEEYKGNSNKLRCKCAKCGNLFTALPSTILKGHGCRKCIPLGRTNEEFLKELETINPSVEVLDSYKGANVKNKCRCRKCGNVWEATAHSLLQGYGCRKCGAKSMGEKRLKKQEVFEAELGEINPDVKVLGIYIGNSKPILCQCLICKHEWSPTPQDLLRGRSCPNCFGYTSTSLVEKYIFLAFTKVLGNDAVLSRNSSVIGKELDVYIPNLHLAFEPGAWFWHSDKLSDDKRKRELCKQNGIRLITIYDSCKTGYVPDDEDVFVYDFDLADEKNIRTLSDLLVSIMKEYELDYEQFTSRIDDIVIEAKRLSRRRGTTKFIEELSSVNPDIEVLGEFHRVHEKIRCKCKKCGYIWNGIPSGMLRGAGCPKCNGGYTKTHEEFLEQLNIINPDIEVLGKYEGDAKRILCRCKLCGNEWLPTATSLIQKHGCPDCKRKTVSLKNTRTHEKFVEEMNEINSNIEVLGMYVNARSKVKCKCKVCSNIWEAIPDTLINRKTGCPYCNNKKVAKGFNDLLTTRPDLAVEWNYKKNTILPTELTAGSNKKVWWICREGHEWQTSPNHRSRGTGCPTCNRKKQ